MAGVFIVLEGIDGCGKTSALFKIAEKIANQSKKYDHILIKRYDHILVTREPTYSNDAGRKARELLKKDSDPKKNAEECLRLYVEDRKEHLKKDIIPALEKNYVVLCDRFKYSTMAFQKEQGIPIQKIISLHEGMPSPDLTLILDLPAEVAFDRTNKRTEEVKEKKFEHLDFMKKLRNNYLEIPKLLQDEKIEIIKADQDREKVADDIFKKIIDLKILEKLEK